MAPLTQKIHAEQRMRELLREADLPQPDAVEYGESCIRLRYDTRMVCIVIDLDADSGADPDAPQPEPQPAPQPEPQPEPVDPGRWDP